MIQADAIRSYWERKLTALRSVEQFGSANLREQLLREDLRFAERVLSRQVGPHHYELSIFVGGAEPDIMSYYDSAGHDYPRSRAERGSNPRYYREQKYAVIDLLDTPNGSLKLVPKTRGDSYSYTSSEQQSAIGSTVLYRFSNDPPAALVITCDKEDAFRSDDAEITTFVRAVGLAFQTEMLSTDLIGSERKVARLTGTNGPLVTQSACGPDDLRWIHISDLHFGAPNATHRFDQTRVLEALRRDAILGKEVDLIFVTGDIAFSGSEDEYAKAIEWLLNLAKCVGVKPDVIRFIPGNHDIQRDIARKSPLLRGAHETLRKDAAKLDEYLSEKESRTQLARKMELYQKELVRRFKGHPGLDNGDFDWAERIRTSKGREIVIVGLCTVWVSDDQDGGGDPAALTPNMMISASQLSKTLTGSPDLVIVLTHHPVSWLFRQSSDLLRGYLVSHPHVHLCGHIHEPEGTLIRRVGETSRSITFVAGAAHGDIGSNKHGYAWGALRWDEKREGWVVGWAPRVFVPDRNEFRPESTRYDLDGDHYAWETLTGRSRA